MNRFPDFSHRFRQGLVGIVLTIMVIASGQFFDQVPFLNANRTYSGLFGDVGGLRVGDDVQVAGVNVGKVQDVLIEGAQVKIVFTAEDIQVGDRSELAIKTSTALGTKHLDLKSRGEHPLGAGDVIPADRTSTPYLLTDALGDLTQNTSELETEEFSSALEVLGETLEKSAPNLGIALEGVSEFSNTIAKRDEQILTLFTNAEKVTGVLAERSTQLNRLMLDGATLFSALQGRQADIDRLLGGVAGVAAQIRGLIDENQQQLQPALKELDAMTALLAKHRGDIQKSLTPLQQYATSLGESVSSGPFFNAYVMNILPGQYLQPFIDAAFAEQGIDLDKVGEALFPVPCGRNSPEGTTPPGGGPAVTDQGCPEGFPRTGGG